MPDNVGSRERVVRGASERFLMAFRSGRPEHSTEAEGVNIVAAGDQLLLILDDGERLEFDALELRTAVADLTAPRLAA